MGTIIKVIITSVTFIKVIITSITFAGLLFGCNSNITSNITEKSNSYYIDTYPKKKLSQFVQLLQQLQMTYYKPFVLKECQ